MPDCSWKRPPFRQDTDDHPVVGVNWHDARAFCEWLTQLDQDAGALNSDQWYELPSKDDFSRMAKDFEGGANRGNYAGAEVRSGAWNWSWDVLSGHSDAFARTAPVGASYQWSTPEGLFDIGGNVAEWCSDWYATNMNSAETLEKIHSWREDGGGEKYRVVRGGSWYTENADDARIATIDRCLPEERNDRVGFRVVIKEAK